MEEIKTYFVDDPNSRKTWQDGVSDKLKSFFGIEGKESIDCMFDAQEIVIKSIIQDALSRVEWDKITKKIEESLKDR